MKKESANDYWNKCRERLKDVFMEKGITRCERCSGTFAMSFHHRHKRIWYVSRKELLGDFNQVILVCAECHYKAEGSRELTVLLFNKLREKE